jgi:hypothetical protein
VYGHGSKWTGSLYIIIREHGVISTKLAPTIILLKLSGFHPNNHIMRREIKRRTDGDVLGCCGATGIFRPGLDWTVAFVLHLRAVTAYITFGGGGYYA